MGGGGGEGEDEWRIAKNVEFRIENLEFKREDGARRGEGGIPPNGGAWGEGLGRWAHLVEGGLRNASRIGRGGRDWARRAESVEGFSAGT